MVIPNRFNVILKAPFQSEHTLVILSAAKNLVAHREIRRQGFTTPLALAHLNVESLPLARGTAGSLPFRYLHT
jgi:hypothetical protein